MSCAEYNYKSKTTYFVRNLNSNKLNNLLTYFGLEERIMKEVLLMK